MLPVSHSTMTESAPFPLVDIAVGEFFHGALFDVGIVFLVDVAVVDRRVLDGVFLIDICLVLPLVVDGAVGHCIYGALFDVGVVFLVDVAVVDRRVLDGVFLVDVGGVLTLVGEGAVGQRLRAALF